MLHNYLKIALRNLQRQRVYSFINIVGLAIGMGSAMLILLWVRDELGYDRFHKNRQDLYRVVAEWKEQSEKWAKTPGPLAAAAKAEIPEVVNAARVHRRPRMVIRQGGQAFYEEGDVRADPALFEMFAFPFITGGPEAVESGIVITRKTARKYFGDEEPVGKSLNINNWYDIAITGVIADLPHNSYLQFDFVSELESLTNFWAGGFTWGNFVHETYVQLQPGADAEVVGKKITQLLIKNAPVLSAHLTKLYLQPMTDAYLSSDIGGNQFAVGDRKYVYIFSVVAGFVLLIACINFMNLATARSLKRAKEVGLRKVIGSSRAQLIKQFLGESLFLTFFAAILAALLVEVLLPWFNHLSGKSLALDYTNLRLLLGLATIVVGTGGLAGSYPALYLSAFAPIRVLKGGTPILSESGRGSFRKALVVAQFALSIMLLICTSVIYKQVQFLTHKKLGFDKENVIFMPAKANLGEQYHAVKQQLLQHPEILDVTVQGCVPTNTIDTRLVSWQGMDPQRQFPVEINAVDYNYVDVLNLELAAGRNFASAFFTDAAGAFIVNEAAATMMELEDPVGEEIRVGERKGTIVGVLKNVHFKSLHQKIEPQIFHVLTDYNSELLDLFGIVLIKVRGGAISPALAAIENVWQQVNPNYPFECHFLDQTYDNLYNSEKRTSAIFNYFALLAVVISCLGLFGLASFMTENRTREIGIRKVLGASVSKIVILLTSDFSKWVLLANVFAWPVAWFAMRRWLEDFAYRTEVGWWMFALAGGAGLSIALLTVSTQAIRAAVANPVASLRYE
ncbi:MAG TPA: ABC transporter permease [bacterium]